MKYLLAIIIASGFFFQGCYTVLWTPDRSMPEYYETNNYYYDNDIYITYYDYPWWVEVAPAYNDYNNNAPERKSHDRIIRNNGGRDTGGSREPVIRTGSAGVSGGSSSGSSSSETNKTERKSTTEDSSPKTERSSSGNNDKVRNSGSDRNSGGRR